LPASHVHPTTHRAVSDCESYQEPLDPRYAISARKNKAAWSCEMFEIGRLADSYV